MPDITEKKDNETLQNPSGKSQLAWFIGLYAAGLIITAIIVYILRALLGLN